MKLQHIKLNKKKTSMTVNQLDIEERIIEDIKEMDMDLFKELIHFMYPDVEAEEIKGKEGEILKISLIENSDSNSLDQVF